MHARMVDIVTDLESALARVHGFASEYPAEAWSRRPEPGSWSPGECIAHLNITSEAYIRVLPTALEEARRKGGSPPRTFRLDPTGWLVMQLAGRKRRFASKTPSAFTPVHVDSRDVLVREFERLQGEVIALVRSADGLPIHAVRMVSPFAEQVRYSVYSGLRLIPDHQHRHLDQAERAFHAGGEPGRSSGAGAS